MAKSVLLSAIIPANSQAGVPSGFYCVTSTGSVLGNFTRAQLTGGTIVSVADNVFSITCDSSGTTCTNQETAVIQPYTTNYNVYVNCLQYQCPTCATFGSANITISIPTSIGVTPGDFVSVDGTGGYLLGSYSTTTTTPTGIVFTNPNVYQSCILMCSV